MTCPICDRRLQAGQRIYCSARCQKKASQIRNRIDKSAIRKRITELEELNEILLRENRMLRKYGNGLMADIQVAKEESLVFQD